MKIILIVVATAIAVFFLLALTAMKKRRARLRREFRSYLEAERPDLRVASETPMALRLSDSAGADRGTLYLYRVYREAPPTASARREFYRKFVATLAEGDAALKHLTPDDRVRLRPRIVNDPLLAALRSQLGTPLPAVSFGLPGLHAVVVLDSENSVAYLLESQLTEMGLNFATALEVAKQNLAGAFPKEPVRSAVSTANLNVVKTMDTYDAARLLLVPAYLEGDESLVALIPDRDTLVLTREPSSGDWSGLRKLAKKAAGKPLYDRPLIVTRAGFSPAPG